MTVVHMKVIKVQWTDAAYEDAGIIVGQPCDYQCYTNTSIGYLVTDQGRLVLAHELQEPNDVSHPAMLKGITIIPLCCVLSVETLG